MQTVLQLLCEDQNPIMRDGTPKDKQDSATDTIPDDPTKVVRLEGNADGPRIILSPTAYDYGSPYIGCETSQVVEIRNRGTQDLTVSDIQVFTSSPDQFSVDLAPLDNGPLPWTLGPYQDDRDGPISEFWVDYLPIDTFSDDGLVQVQSNDPLTPVATVEVKGTGTVFGNNTDSFEYDATPQVDALFVLDRSSDTRDALRTLDEAIPALQTTLSDASIDYRLAAVVSDDGCIAGAEPWIDATLTGSDATLAFEVMADSVGLAPAAFWPYAQGLIPKDGCLDAACTEDCDRDLDVLKHEGYYVGPSASVGAYSFATPPCDGACEDQDLGQLADVVRTTPVSVCVDASLWDDYTGGVLKASACSANYLDLDHCVQVVGFDSTGPEPYWIVRNSWSTAWGESGFIRLQFDANTCGLADEAVVVDVDGAVPQVVPDTDDDALGHF